MKSEKIQFGISYIDTGSWLHGLNGITKLIWFIAWVSMVLTTFDVRILSVFIIVGLWLLQQSKIPFRIYKPLLLATSTILLINAFFMYLLAPSQGPELIGSETVLLETVGNYTISLEALFYLLAVTLKYFSMFPIALVFVFTTHPTEFSASLNRLGVPYKIAYAFSLTLRYLPEVKSNFISIMHAQQARGVDLSKNVSLLSRMKNLSKILGPLIFSSLDRADTISNAMMLRGFGRYNSRTWYSKRSMTRLDFSLVAFAPVVLLVLIFLKVQSPTLFWYPF